MDFSRAFTADSTIAIGNCILRSLRESDAAELYSYYCNPRVHRHLNWYGPPSEEAAADAIKRWNDGFSAGRIMRLGIADGQTDHVIGTIFLSDVRGSRAEVGYELAEPYWGLGIMSAALRAVLKLAFGALRLQRVQAFTALDNALSQRLLARNGFHVEGVLRAFETHVVTGMTKDMMVHACLRDEFMAQQTVFEDMSQRRQA